MKHIDREDLYTNLEARVMYLHSFLDFSSRTSFPPLGFSHGLLSHGLLDAGRSESWPQTRN